MPEEKPPANIISLSLPKRLGDLMVQGKVLTEEQLAQALQQQRQSGGKLGTILIHNGAITEDQLIQFLGEQCGIQYIRLKEVEQVDPEVLAKVPESLARQHVIFPYKIESGILSLAVADPLNVLVLDDLKMMTGLDIQAVLASDADIVDSIDRHYGKQSAQGALEEIVKATGSDEKTAQGVDVVSHEQEQAAAGESILSLEKSGDDAPIIQIVNLIISSAIKAKASDIHLEPFPKEMKVRFRIDGVLNEQPAPPKRFQNALASRIKIMANLDIAEKRLPQDGRIKLKIGAKEYALRVSTLPVVYGEKIVMRILDSSGLQVDVKKLGFEPEAYAIFQRALKAPYGINLITGPTGSGKSTTLYSALSALNEPGVNISTVEDPVEYQLVGINQVNVNPEIGLNFAAGLRSFLRQDPDIIMVGEIRDLETISIAINAALTGHLVFSTLHTNDSAGAITRMGMMGIEPFLMSSALLMVVAQRLVRSICPRCRESYEVDVDWLIKLGVSKNLMQAEGGKVALAKGRGCDNCAGTGYRGRAGLYEVLDVTDPIRELILEKAPIAVLKEQARKQGMLTLRMCAVRKLLSGATTVEEMIRVTASDAG
ncbi:MAG: ATPase, T2SS/T4P/T4SS family [Elusimicrobiota bacterium]|jgi:type IV pilus assembly protein PilB